jgi:hypothetical protein
MVEVHSVQCPAPKPAALRIGTNDIYKLTLQQFESPQEVPGCEFVMQLSAFSGRCYQLRVSRGCLSTRATSSPVLIDLKFQPKLYRCFRRDTIHARAAQNITLDKARSVCIPHNLTDAASDKTRALQSQGGRMRPPARVLLTNDDGPESSFFQAWVQHVKDVLK